MRVALPVVEPGPASENLHRNAPRAATRTDGLGHEYWLTPAGESAREIVRALGHWGLAHTRDRITADDLDPALIMWTMRQRTDMAALPDHRVVIRFEFSGVPANRTRLRIMWLVLDRSGVVYCGEHREYDLLIDGHCEGAPVRGSPRPSFPWTGRGSTAGRTSG